MTDMSRIVITHSRLGVRIWRFKSRCCRTWGLKWERLGKEQCHGTVKRIVLLCHLLDNSRSLL